MAKLTSGGIEMGLRPICDCWEDVAENALAGCEKAGRRNDGIDADGADITLERTRACVLDNIICCC